MPIDPRTGEHYVTVRGDCDCWDKAPTGPAFRGDRDHLSSCPMAGSYQPVGAKLADLARPGRIEPLPAASPSEAGDAVEGYRRAGEFFAHLRAGLGFGALSMRTADDYAVEYHWSIKIGAQWFGTTFRIPVANLATMTGLRAIAEWHARRFRQQARKAGAPEVAAEPEAPGAGWQDVTFGVVADRPLTTEARR